MASKASLPVLRILCFGDSLTSGHSCMGMIHHPYNEAMESRLAATLPVVKIESDEDGADGDVVTTDLGGTFLSRIQEQCMSFLACGCLPTYPFDEEVLTIPVLSKSSLESRNTTGLSCWEGRSKLLPYSPCWRDAISTPGYQRKPREFMAVLTFSPFPCSDIAFQIDPDRIFNSFKRIYAVPLSHGSKVLALTVPEAGIKGASLRERMGTRRNKLNDLIKNYEKETENL